MARVVWAFYSSGKRCTAFPSGIAQAATWDEHLMARFGQALGQEQGDAWSVMASYNSINGVPACQNADLLQRRLRGEWGFRGFVVSDWFAVRGTTSSAACIKGGLSLEMPGKGSRYRYKNLKASYEQGQFSEAELDDNLRGLLTAMVLTGHLDSCGPPGQRISIEHQALARVMAEAGMILLKNDGALLPLDPTRIRKIAVIGPKLRRRNCLPLWGGQCRRLAAL